MSSSRSSPMNGGYDSATGEPAVRLTVRKDLFPDMCHSKEESDLSNDDQDNQAISCVKLETDFEQSIDEIQKIQNNNGVPKKSRSKKHKDHQKESKNLPVANGYVPSIKKKRKSSSIEGKYLKSSSHNSMKVKGGKNLNLVSSSEFRVSDNDDEDTQEEINNEEEESSEDECIKKPVYTVQRQTGKPYSHQLSQLSNKKKKSKEKRTHAVTPCSGKPRSMLDICSSHSKKKSKKNEQIAVYQSLILDTNTNLKIKIRRTNVETVTPTPLSVADIGQRKSKKKRAASPVPSESSGEEYDPSKGDTRSVITVAAPKSKHPPSKTKKQTSKVKGKSEKTERSRVNVNVVKDLGPQSPWAQSIPEEILSKIFGYVIKMQGTLPTIIRLGRVCKLWHTASCRPDLWRHMDLAHYTVDKCKTDYKLVWLLENRLSQCQTLNIAHWKVCNIPWVLACVADYSPGLKELSIAGWNRLQPEQLYELFQNLPNLQKIDLSQTSEIGGSGTCLSAASVARLVENFGSRLTQLTIANNKFTALQQILSSIAAHCPNLEVLDISGARATSHPGGVPLEALQKGCPKVRVFRAANAQLTLLHCGKVAQAEAQGWTQLEELSIAGEMALERVPVGEYGLNDEALERLVKGATRLRLLDLRALQKLTDSSIVRVPAWDLQHLFLGGCKVSRQNNSCLELICEKWSHSLIELDLSWASAARALDDAVAALADADESRLKVLNLCGSSVSLPPVKKVLLRCKKIESLNLSSCRALPRGMKRLFTGKELQDLKDSYDPEKVKAKEESKDKKETEKREKKDSTPKDTPVVEASPKQSEITSPKTQEATDSKNVFQEPQQVHTDVTKLTEVTKSSPDTKSSDASKEFGDSIKSPCTPKLLSPAVQPKPDSSSTPRSDTSKTDVGSPRFSPMSRNESQNINSPDVMSDSVKNSGSWNLGQFKSAPANKSEASPLGRPEGYTKMKSSKHIEQCSPTTSQDNRPSPETHSTMKQDVMKTPNSYYGNYSPMTRQDSQFSSQRSPYSAQPSPAQPSPYSAQPSPYSTQPSPYSSQPSPYSAQPSPDTSQMTKTDLQKSSSSWNTGGYSPMPKQPAPFSPHPSPEAMSAKPKASPRATYSPRSVGGYSPLCPFSEASSRTLTNNIARKATEMVPGAVDMPGAWLTDKFAHANRPHAPVDSMPWGGASFSADNMARDIPSMLSAQQQQWTGLPSFDSTIRQSHEELPDPWTLGQFRLDGTSHNPFEQSVNFDSLNTNINHQSVIANFLDDNMSQSRVD